MHSLAEILAETRKNSSLCMAIEKNHNLCFKERERDSKGKITSKYCAMHRCRLRRYGSFDLPLKSIKKCKFIDCKEKFYGKGFCKKHYKKHIRLNHKKCSLEECQNNVDAKGYCQKHYLRYKKNGDPNKFVKKSDYTVLFKNGHLPHNAGKIKYDRCIVPDCPVTKENNPYRQGITKGLCRKHYTRWYKHKDYTIVK